MLVYELHTEYIELNKLLKITRLCSSGGEAKQTILDGMVSVNGEVESRIRRKLKPGDIVKFNEHQVRIQRLS